MQIPDLGGLDLRYAAIYKKLYARHIARFIGSEETTLAISSESPSLRRGTLLLNCSFIALRASPQHSGAQ